MFPTDIAKIVIDYVIGRKPVKLDYKSNRDAWVAIWFTSDTTLYLYMSTMLLRVFTSDQTIATPDVSMLDLDAGVIVDYNRWISRPRGEI